MFTSIEDFVSEWTKEAELTEAAMKVLTDESLKQAIVAERRTLGQIAWHLVMSVHYISNLGLDFDGPTGGERAPESAAVIAEQYRCISRAMLQAVRTQWSDETLQETRELMGEVWKNSDTLLFTLMHQAHHRGQMTVLMRHAGLRPPGLYGPAYEDWIDKGLAPLV